MDICSDERQFPLNLNGWGDFLLLYYFGFANSQSILYISSVEDTMPTPTYNYSNEYGLGFANSQPFLYI